MAKRISLANAACPVARALDVIGDRWSLLIVRDAFDGVRRFSEFQSQLGIAKGMLAARLRDLVERGVLTTEPAAEGSAYQNYVLTERGRSLFLVIVALRQWGEEHLFGNGERHSLLVDTARNAPVARLELRSNAGRVLRWNEMRVLKVEEKKRRPTATRRNKRAARKNGD